jgi:hypothetical protein
MSVVNMTVLQFNREPTVKNDILEQTPFINGGHPNAVRPLENLSNRYYGIPQSFHIARTNPPVMAATSPVALNKTGMGATYRLSDESLRQYSLGAYLTNMANSYYQTRP